MRRIAVLLWAFCVCASLIPARAQVEPSLLIVSRPVYLTPPAIDAAGERIAFGSAVASNGSVANTPDAYVAGPDGAGLRRLTTDAAIGAIALTADGSRLAYTTVVPSDTGSSEQVHLVETATGADRAVLIDKEGCIVPLIACAFCSLTCVNTPHFSPDGRRIVYSVRRNQPLRVVNADGTGAAPLPIYTGAIAPAAQPVLTSNGTLVFTSSAPSGPTFAASATDVYTINLDGSGLRNLTRFGPDASIFASNAVISADGATVVFESNHAAPNAPSQVWLARNGELRQLSANNGAAGSPSVSADGSLAVFEQNGQIWLVRTNEKSAPEALTSFKTSFAQDPVISRDGTRVAFSLGPRDNEPGAIYSVATAAGDPRPVYAPRWMAPNAAVVASPGALVTVYGANLAPDGVTSADKFPLPDSLAGVSLLVNGSPVPLTSVTPWQVNAHVPQQTAVGTVKLQFGFAGGASTPAISADVKSSSPELFSYPAPGLQPAASYQQAAAFHAGSAVAADVRNPAQAGETLETYGTGLGTTVPMVPGGDPSPVPPARTAATPLVRIGGQPAAVRFSGLVPGLVGVYQVNVVVPSGLRPGLQSIGWQLGDFGQYSSSIAVR